MSKLIVHRLMTDYNCVTAGAGFCEEFVLNSISILTTKIPQVSAANLGGMGYQTLRYIDYLSL